MLDLIKKEFEFENSNIFHWWEKRRIALNIINLFLFIACENKNVKDSISNKIKTTEDTLFLNKSGQKEDNIKPYADVNNLSETLKKKFEISVASKLDSICNLSDGDLSEKFYEISNNLFENHLEEFTNYLVENPKSCLKSVIIKSISAELSVYKDEAREKQIKIIKDGVFSKAKKLRLSKQQTEILTDIFNKVDPSLFD